MGRKERLKLAFDISGMFLIITNVINLICIIVSSIYSFKFYETGLPCFGFGIPIIMLIIGIVLFYIGKYYTLDKEKITDVNLLKYTILGTLLILIALEVIISQSFSFLTMHNISLTDYNNIDSYFKSQYIVKIIGYSLQLIYGLFLIIKFNRKNTTVINDIAPKEHIEKLGFKEFKNSIKYKPTIIIIILSIINWIPIFLLFFNYSIVGNIDILIIMGLFYIVTFINSYSCIIIASVLIIKKRIHLLLAIIIIIINVVYLIWGTKYYGQIFWLV